jgi:hypothetical protein
MKYTRDTYLDYKIFCKSVVLEAKNRLDTAKEAAQLTRVLLFIATIIGQSLLIFTAIAALASLGALAYFGSMGALIAANPWLAAILIAVGGASIGGSIYVLYQEKEALNIVKDVVVDRYEGDFRVLISKLSTNAHILPDAHVAAVEGLLNRAMIDLINGLHKVGKIEDSTFKTLIAAIK